MQTNAGLIHRGFRVIVGVAMAAALWPLLAGPSSAHAQEQPPIRLRGSIVAGGIGAFSENRWALVRATVQNHTDEAQELRLIYAFNNEPDRQFVRRTWLPPQSQRVVIWPSRLAEVPPDDKSAEGRAMVLQADREISFDDEPGTVIVSRDRALTAMVSGGDSAGDIATDGVIAARLAAGLERRLSYTTQLERNGPRYTLGWDPADVVAFASPSVDLDASQRQALRRWLRGGGTLWVMADMMRADDLERLLGDDWRVAEVDRVGLNEVRYDWPAGARQRPGDSDEPPSPVVTEQPVRMVRVVAPDYHVLMSVRGWPALMEREVGGGRIVVTTVNARGWVAPEATRALQTIADCIYPTTSMIAAPAAEAADVATGFIDAQIGYEVASRPVVAGVLGAYVLLFLVVGLILLARGKGERMGPIGITFALLAAITLAGIGLASRGKVEPTNATLQLVRVDPGSSVVTVTGTMGMFAPFEREATLASRRGGWAWPSGAAGGGSKRRLMWTDLDYWTWERLDLSGGKAQRMDFATTAEFSVPNEPALRFGPEGLTGEFRHDPAISLQDMVLIAGRVAMRVRGSTGRDDATAVNIGPGDILPDNTYVSADVLTLTQQRRSELLARLVAPGQDRGPTLFAWSGLIDDGLEGRRGHARAGRGPVAHAAGRPGRRARRRGPRALAAGLHDRRPRHRRSPQQRAGLQQRHGRVAADGPARRVHGAL